MAELPTDDKGAVAVMLDPLALCQSTKKQLSTVRMKRLGAGLAGLVLVGSLIGCSPAADGAAAKPATSTPAVEQSENAPGPTTPATSAAPTPTSVATSAAPMPDVKPFRSWKLADGVGAQLTALEGSPSEQWAILKKIFIDHDETGTYIGDINLNSTLPRETLSTRALTELAIIADIGTDPNISDDLKIATVWANLAIIDDESRQFFMNFMIGERSIWEGDNPEWAEILLEERQYGKTYHFGPPIIMSESIEPFHSPLTDQDHTGVTFTSIHPGDHISEYSLMTVTVVFDPQNWATQILRIVQGDVRVSYNVGETPRLLTEIPEIQKVLEG